MSYLLSWVIHNQQSDFFCLSMFLWLKLFTVFSLPMGPSHNPTKWYIKSFLTWPLATFTVFSISRQPNILCPSFKYPLLLFVTTYGCRRFPLFPTINP